LKIIVWGLARLEEFGFGFLDQLEVALLNEVEFLIMIRLMRRGILPLATRAGVDKRSLLKNDLILAAIN
jgi:hypothetical protein